MPQIKKGNYTYGTTINSLFGVNLPPKKKKKADRYVTIRFILQGVVPSKKNEWIPKHNWWNLKKRIFKSRVASMAGVIKMIDRDLKVWIHGNKRYQPFIEKSKNELQPQMLYWFERYGKYGLSYPITDASISIYFYWKDKYQSDNTNKADSIHDLLVEAGVITDDAWRHLNPVCSESEYYGGEITKNITEIALTVRLYNNLA